MSQYCGLMADHWLRRRRVEIKTFIRVIFGIVWLIDGSLKFSPGMSDTFVQMIQGAAAGQPAWLSPWFGFWANIVSVNPAFWVYLIGVGEVLLGLALIFGFIRKISYIAGMALSLFIWGVPEGFGGPYGPGATDIGTGVIYALVFLALMTINAGYGPSRLSLDYWIEKRVKWWHRVAEFR